MQLGLTGGAALSAASATPGTESELAYAVLAQLLQQAKQQTAQLADSLDERKQVQLKNGIRA